MPSPPPKQPKQPKLTPTLKPSSPKRPSKRTELADWLEQHQPEVVGPQEWIAIQTALAPVSDSYLRRLLRESGAPLHSLVEGVRQEDFESLERSLLDLLADYEGSQDPRAVRKLVAEARDHAGFALKKHPEKAEMILWMRTWLENPGIFPHWLRLRKETLRAEAEAAGT